MRFWLFSSAVNELATMMETSNEWIIERTGIEERHWVSEGETGTTLATAASKQAIERAGLTPRDIDMIILATLSPDFNFPGTGVFVQRALGLKEIPCLDIRQQCTGFIYGLWSVAATRSWFLPWVRSKTLASIGIVLLRSAMPCPRRALASCT